MSVSSITLPSGFQQGQFTPAFDPTETNSANQVPAELQVVVANYGSDLQFLVPSYAPFFADTFVLQYTDTNGDAQQTLAAGRDFFFAFPFIGASRACQKPVFGAIVVANNRLAGTFSLTYQSQGVVVNQALELLTTVDPYVTAWEQVMDYPSTFPVITTPWDKPDGTSITDAIVAVLSLKDAVFAATTAAQVTTAQAIAHVFDMDNPHGDDAVQIGLEDVTNLPAATNAQASDPTNATTYISPGQLRLAFAAGVPAAADTSAGTLMLNQGLTDADASDPVKALTAQGFLNLVASRNNPLGAAFNKAQVEGTFTPFPFSFPCVWNGNTYASMPALIQGIQNYVGIYPLEYSANQGKIWFPSGTDVPDLTITH